MIGERLRIARKKSGLSLRDLATRMGDKVTHAAIGKYERDEMMPTSTILVALADALSVSLEFLASPMEVSLGTIEFRKKSSTTAADRAAVEAAVLEHVERYLMIEEILDLNSAEWKAPFKPIAIDDVAKAEQVAMKARDVWKLGNAPIADVTELLEEHGIKVMRLTLPDSVSGLTCLVHRPGRESVPVIVVNEAYNFERIRFTLLHELGHRLMRVINGADEEKAAHRFASAFLMPADHLREQVGKHRASFGVAELMATKRIYRVAATALLIRFRDLGIMSPEQYLAFFQTTARHWRKNEPQQLDPRLRIERPQRFRRLCFRALAEGMISFPKAAELLQERVANIAQEMRGDEPPEDRRQ